MLTKPTDVFQERRGSGHVYPLAPQIHLACRVGEAGSARYTDGMHSDVHHFCHQCLICSSYNGTGCRFQTPLQQVLVGGPFQRVGVDILEMPQTAQGNRYIMVFIDYLQMGGSLCCSRPDQRD